MVEIKKGALHNDLTSTHKSLITKENSLMRKSKSSQVKSQEAKSNLQLEIPQTSSLMGLLQFGSQMLLSEAIKAEISEHLGRSYYQHSSPNEKNKGYRHGIRKTTIDTPIGAITYDRPRVHGAKDFQSQFHPDFTDFNSYELKSNFYLALF